MDSIFETRPFCELCGHQQPEVLYDEAFNDGETFKFLNSYYKGKITVADLSNGRYQLLRCPMCNFVWQGQVLSDLGVKNLYDKWIDPYESLQSQLTRGYHRLAAIVHQIALIPFLFDIDRTCDLKVLDFGMGWGGWCQIAKGLGMNVEGAELSVQRIDFARKQGILVQTDLFSTHEKYDFINSEQVFEHVKKPKELLQKLVQHLNPSGILYISVPNGARYISRHNAGIWQPGKNCTHPLEHINTFSHRHVLDLATSAGLSPVPNNKIITCNLKSVIRGNGSISGAFEDIRKHILSTSIRFQKL